MYFPEIGERLRAYRMGAGIPVEDLARRLGVSRAAVYRYEAGQVVKIETLSRISRLLGVSITALLGIGIEYIASAVAFFERQRQLEEKALRMTVVFGPLAYLLTSPDYDRVLGEVFREAASTPESLPEQQATALMEVLRTRKSAYLRRRPGIVNIVSLPELERFIASGLAARSDLSAETAAARRAHARWEIGCIREMLMRPPMGVQIGLVRERLPTTGFQLLRLPERTVVVTSPFRLGEQPNIGVGVATISDAEDAIHLFSEITDTLWRSVLTGSEAVAQLDMLLA